MKKRALFLDRDGVIVKMVLDKKTGLLHLPGIPSEVKFNLGIFELLQVSSRGGNLNIIVSNQPDIGLKKITERNFELVRKKMNKEIKLHQATIDGQYYCFHHPYAQIKKYKMVCNCRKPKSGLLAEASQKHNIDLDQSFLVGDSAYDIIAGERAGCKTILLTNNPETGYLSAIYKDKELENSKPDYIVKNLYDVIPIISSI